MSHELLIEYSSVLREIGLLRDFLQEEVHESRTTYMRDKLYNTSRKLHVPPQEEVLVCMYLYVEELRRGHSPNAEKCIYTSSLRLVLCSLSLMYVVDDSSYLSCIHIQFVTQIIQHL